FFLEQQRAGKHVVIIVDEAQNLSSSALEELRLLSCIDTSDQRIVSIVLTGQPSLDDLLDAPGLTQLRQRARLRQRLDAMHESETLDYIRHRLEIAGGNVNEIFEPETLPEIHRLTGGIPRLINTLCDTALTACMVENQPRVNLEAIDNVVHELRWQWLEEQKPKTHGRLDPAPPGSAPDNHVSLMVYRSGQLVDQIDAVTFPCVMGRSKANDLVIIDNEVSRRHALIDCIGGVFVVEDLNSRNGIQINHKPRGRALLRSGDIITLGHVDVVFYVEKLGNRSKPIAEQAVRHATVSEEDTGQRTGIHEIDDRIAG
ncbi:MAG: FHA domain-containing protein, partial [Gammaproteobacteria bacterium]|nr:FHA domain-containing protein [Gammaproteobacteria bacterium]